VRPVFQPATWLLPLTSGARNLMTAFIALGAVFLVVLIVVYAAVLSTAGSAVGDTATAIAAENTLDGAYTTLGNELTSFGQATENCNENLTCVTKLDGQMAGEFKTLSGRLANTRVPAGAAADKAQVGADADALVRAFTKLSQATTATQYESTVTSTGLEKTLNGFQQDSATLETKLKSY
jgi:uncharacterized membrane protein YfbV (UPF0208 family)